MLSDVRVAYILDDEADIGAVACRVLQSCGFEAVAFDEPSSFISKVESNPPELVILDLALGRTDAVEVIRKLEAVGYPGQVMLMSGRANKLLSEITQIGIAHGLSMLPPLNKPFRQAEIKARLSTPPERQSVQAQTPRLPKVSSIDEALQNQWLELWYQPKIDLESFMVCGAEALIRVNHPDHGILLPEQFLPPSGDPQCRSLASFVLASAISDWKKLAAQNIKTKIAVNMPASVVLDPGFVSEVRGLIPLDGSLTGLVVEIAEDEILRDADAIREVAIQLELSSVELSIDDFGTAHASLARLRDVPCAELKLDKSFVSNCSKDEKKRKICQTVVDLAKKFDVSACAEGVETHDDLKTIVDMGFNTAQGFLFAKPMRLESFTAMMLNEALQYLRKTMSSGPTIIEVEEYRPTVLNAISKDGAYRRSGKDGMPGNVFFGAV